MMKAVRSEAAAMKAVRSGAAKTMCKGRRQCGRKRRRRTAQGSCSAGSARCGASLPASPCAHAQHQAATPFSKSMRTLLKPEVYPAGCLLVSAAPPGHPA